MNCGIHNTATKMGAVRRSRRPFRAHADGDSTQGSAFGSTLGYIPAAASRLKILVILPALNVRNHTLVGYFRKSR